MAGESGPIDVPLPKAMVMAAFFGIATYNSATIYLWVFRTFRRYGGLYFWSILASNTGIALHAVTVLLRFFSLAPGLPMACLISLGWWLMVTGQAVVLWSRSHLVVGDPRKLRWVAAMIASTFALVEVPTAAMFVASNAFPPPSSSSSPLSPQAAREQARLLRAFNALERVQVAALSAQETAISALYLWEARRALGGLRVLHGGAAVRGVLLELAALLALVAALDASLMATEYTDNFEIQTTYKPVVYSVKLQAELLVLNDLMSLVRSRVRRSRRIPSGDDDAAAAAAAAGPSSCYYYYTPPSACCREDEPRAKLASYACPASSSPGATTGGSAAGETCGVLAHAGGGIATDPPPGCCEKIFDGGPSGPGAAVYFPGRAGADRRLGV